MKCNDKYVIALLKCFGAPKVLQSRLCIVLKFALNQWSPFSAVSVAVCDYYTFSNKVFVALTRMPTLSLRQTSICNSISYTDK
jgi:hypothetical protein